jgi:hypothetical protein
MNGAHCKPNHLGRDTIDIARLLHRETALATATGRRKTDSGRGPHCNEQLEARYPMSLDSYERVFATFSQRCLA